MKNALFLLVLVTAFGCKPILTTVYGIKKPKLEDDQSVRKYLLKKHVDTANVYVLKDLQSFVRASEMDFLNIPDATFFNGDGYYVAYKDPGVSCNASVGAFIDDIRNFENRKADSTKTLDAFMSLMKISPHHNRPKADVNVLITWTTYAGRLNKQKAFAWMKLLDQAKAKGIRVNYYLVNCDFHKSWDMPEAVLDAFGIKK